ncbi:DUF4190 domain-containing protein [Sanguibacter antarcticus]|uniref:Uncharacterized protein DUF4190 n=1 Tax=Sanguibacter antarcticus TaxID=372484 RepID=A0A2A9E7U0_9MICO|nr:DUF4190 domain-containing protein [Sanguibacter antarcticus]PFG34365.1 uncharacterized protein DUF4190 [Sanguibacter antarcticus]
MSSPNFSKEPGDGAAPSNPYSTPAADAGTPGPSSYESAPPQGAPYQQQYPSNGPGGYPYGAPTATNPMALGSLIASIAGWTVVPVVGWIVGVILGHIARRQLRENTAQGAGLALAGLITGYVGLALLVLAFVLLFVFVAVVGVSYESWDV